MDNKKLKLLIESNIRSIIKEEKRKIILERKMNALIKEAKKVKLQKAKLRESIADKKITLLFINESIKFHEGIWDSIRRGLKGVFGGGLSPEDLQAISQEKEAKKTAITDDKITRITSNAGKKIDDLSNILNTKFSSKLSRIPEIDDLEALNSATKSVYSSIKELENKDVKDIKDIKIAKKASLTIVKKALDRLNVAKQQVKINLENQINKVQELISQTEQEIKTNFNDYAKQLEKITPAPESTSDWSVRKLEKAIRRTGSNQVSNEPAPSTAGIVPAAGAAAAASPSKRRKTVRA